MNEPQFQPGQSAVATIGGTDIPVKVVGVEPAENRRGFHGVVWVYHVHPAGADFGCDVPDAAVHPTNG